MSSSPKRRVSFLDTSNQVIDVERIDASLIQDLFYNSTDYKRFRQEVRSIVSTANSGDVAATKCNDYSLRRERFQKLVAKSNRKTRERKEEEAETTVVTPAAPTTAKASAPNKRGPRRASMRSSREHTVLQNMRRQVAPSA